MMQTDNKYENLKNTHNIDEICRVCLCSNENLKSIHQKAQISGKSFELSNILSLFTQMRLLEDKNWPSKICLPCASEVYSVAEFQFKYENSIAVLCKRLDFSSEYVDLKDKTTFSESKKYLSDKDNTISSVNKNDLLVSSIVQNKLIFRQETKSMGRIVTSRFRKSRDSLVLRHLCVECGKKFQTKSMLYAHSYTHKPDRPFKCEFCPSAFKQEFRLKVHKVNHENKKLFVCEFCGKGFNHNNALTSHKRSHASVKGYSCELCQKRFVNKGSVLKHIRSIHKGERSHECTVCLKKFARADQLRIHRVTHSGEKPFKCTFAECEKSFATNRALESHLPVHSEVRPYKCKLCSKEFPRESDLKRHDKVHNKRQYQCTYSDCDKTYTNSSGLRDHIARHTGERSFLCTECGKSFIREADLKRHMLCHTNIRPYNCEHCGREFNQLFNYKQHIREHKGELNFICDLCGRSFSRKDTLEKHRKVHLGIKEYICDMCKAAFRSSANLTRHIRVHTGEKPFICQVCEKPFGDTSGLRVHMRSHTGHKPYNCRYCTQSCTTSTALKVHIRSHIGRKPYTCPYCPRTFLRTELQIQHSSMCIYREQQLLNDNNNPAQQHLITEINDKPITMMDPICEVNVNTIAIS